MKAASLVALLAGCLLAGSCRCDSRSPGAGGDARGAGTGDPGTQPVSTSAASGVSEHSADRDRPANSSASDPAPSSQPGRARGDSPSGAHPYSNFDGRYEQLRKQYEGVFRRLTGAFYRAARSADSLDKFARNTGPTLERYDRARVALRRDYVRIAREERRALNRDLSRARRTDRKTGGARNVRKFLLADETREQVRRRQVGQLQRMLDEAALDVGETFRLRFHESLAREVEGLRRSGSSAEKASRARRDLGQAIEQGFAGKTSSSKRRRAYAKHWVGWFLRDRSEPEPPNKTAPELPDRTERVVLKPVRPNPTTPDQKQGPGQPETVPPRADPEPIGKQVVRREAPQNGGTKKTATTQPEPRRTGPAPQVQEADLDCKNNSCNLRQYRRFVARLTRSCRGSELPDVLIKDCFEDFVHVDLSTPRRREIMNFIRFSGENYYDRLRGLRYFEEACYAFRPVLELGEQMLRGATKFSIDQKQEIEDGLRKLRACR